MTTAQEVKEKLSITDVIGGYVKLLPAGKNMKALCPFHKEKTPSFIVSPDRGSWHCFGSCGEGGDVISFVMKYENIDFIEALRILAERAGVSLTRMSRDERQWDVLYAMHRAAGEYFEKLLWSAEGAAALSYIRGRGLTDETVELFGIGFAGVSQDGLSRELGRLRYSMPDIERAGLVFKTDRGTYWDRFRGRLTFPLKNQFGKTVAFTGRVLPIAGADGKLHDPPETGKYVNSPETPLFSKSKLLFGLHYAKDAVRKEKAVILVEGQMDCIYLVQASCTNVVATSGTALTHDHAIALKRLAETIYLFFDNDTAGHAAADRAIALLHEFDVAVKVVDYRSLTTNPCIKDPADIARYAPEKIPDLLAAALPAMEYYISRLLPRDGTITERKKAIRVLLSKIRAFASPVERDHWLHRLSTETGIDDTVLREELAGLPASTDAAAGKRAETAPLGTNKTAEEMPLTRRETISRELATLIAYNHSWHALIKKTNVRLAHPYHDIVLRFGGEGFLSPDSQKLSDELSLRAGLRISEADAAGDSSTSSPQENEVRALIRELAREDMKERRASLMAEIRAAEAKKQNEELAKLLAEFDTLSRKMEEL